MLPSRTLLRLAYSRHSFSRLYSSVPFAQKLAQLQQSSSHSLSDLRELLTHPEIKENVDSVADVFALVKQNAELDASQRADLHNLVLSDLLKHDSSLLTIHMRELQRLGEKMSVDALKEVININKGRVDSSWEIFEKWCAENLELVKKDELQGVLRSLLNKVVYGDPSEQEEGFKLDKTGLLRATWIMQNLDTVDPEIKSHVMIEAVKVGELALVCTLGVESLEQLNHLSPADEKLLVLWSASDSNKLLSKVEEQDLVLVQRVLALSSKTAKLNTELWGESVETQWTKLNTKLPSLATPLATLPSTEQPLFPTLVKALEPFTSNKSSLYTALRLTLLKSVGIHQSNFQEASKLYSEYIVDDKYNVDLYMSAMTQISCYLAAKDKNRIYLQLAESMVPPEHTPVSSLRAQILAHSVFDIDVSLDIYNRWISKLSKQNNEHGYSPAGLLTESLILAFLSRGEREFAFVIRDGATDHGILSGETAQDRVKALTRRYGEIAGEEEETGESSGLLEQEVLKAIERL